MFQESNSLQNPTNQTNKQKLTSMSSTNKNRVTGDTRKQLTKMIYPKPWTSILIWKVIDLHPD